MSEPAISPDEVRSALREYFADYPGIEEVRRNRDEPNWDAAGFDRNGWRTLVRQLGLICLAASPEWDGLGLGAEYLVAAVEECGATLYPGPVRASVLTAAALAGTGPEDLPTEWRQPITDLLSGTVVVGASTCVEDTDLPEHRDGRVSGLMTAVTHGAVADLVVCTVHAADGPAVALVATESAERLPVSTVDLATPLADVVLSSAPAVLLTAAGDVAALERYRTLEALLLAAELVGGAEGCLTRMVDYAKLREQFGKLIGTYQALQHRCSRTAVANAQARALVAATADAWNRGDDRTARQFTLLARADAGDAFTAASSAYIQLSGGVGFTWEHDAHLYFRRARATAAIGGTPAQLRHRAVEAGCLDLLVHGAV